MLERYEAQHLEPADKDAMDAILVEANLKITTVYFRRLIFLGTGHDLFASYAYEVLISMRISSFSFADSSLGGRDWVTYFNPKEHTDLDSVEESITDLSFLDHISQKSSPLAFFYELELLEDWLKKKTRG